MCPIALVLRDLAALPFVLLCQHVLGASNVSRPMCYVPRRPAAYCIRADVRLANDAFYKISVV